MLERMVRKFTICLALCASSIAAWEEEILQAAHYAVYYDQDPFEALTKIVGRKWNRRVDWMPFLEYARLAGLKTQEQIGMKHSYKHRIFS